MNSHQVLDLLRRYESRNVTFVERDGSWPIVWERARGVHVWDTAGKKYLDLTAAFGVAATGHANPRIVRAGQKQMARLLHAMGDVHPHPLKAKLARELSHLTFERWRGAKLKAQSSKLKPNRATGKTIFCNSGFEAVEAALKTAMLATGKPGVIAFEGAYHGLGYGALSATHRQHFRAAFRRQLGGFVHFVPFPAAGRASSLSRSGDEGARRDREDACPTLDDLERRFRLLFRRHSIGAILVEPIQGRGGINVPPRGFLSVLRTLCDEHGALLILDEIYTGFGRTGAWFACEHDGVVPDVICLGKALTGGFPLSACVGRAEVMDAAWPKSTGEAIHTSTFLGHPVGCAMALAQIEEIRRRRLPERSDLNGGGLLFAMIAVSMTLRRLRCSVRGSGLLVGVELQTPDGAPAAAVAQTVIKDLLREGFILLPEGEHGNVISLTPPLTIGERELGQAVQAVARRLHAADARL